MRWARISFEFDLVKTMASGDKMTVVGDGSGEDDNFETDDGMNYD